jgi:hypothetical protein
MDNDYISSPEINGDSPNRTMEEMADRSAESESSPTGNNSARRISGLTAVGLLTVAGIFDLINWIPIVNYIATVGETLVFGFWFWSLGLGWNNPRVLASGAVGLIVSAIPAISALPETILSVAVIIGIVTAEDKLGIKIPIPGTGTGVGVSTPPPLPKV